MEVTSLSYGGRHDGIVEIKVALGPFKKRRFTYSHATSSQELTLIAVPAVFAHHP